MATWSYHRFPTTRWSLVDLAGRDLNDSQRSALNLLLTEYWSPLKTHLVAKKRLDPHEADDLLQGFVTTCILEKQLVNAASASRGKFRSLLVKSLDNYVANEFRARRSLKRQSDRAVSLDQSELAEPAISRDAASLHDAAWATQVLDEAMHRMQLQCAESGRQALWAVFEGRVVAPLLDGREPVDCVEFVRAGDFQSTAQVSNALVTAKRTFARVLTDVLREHGSDESEIQAEVDDLLRCFSQA